MNEQEAKALLEERLLAYRRCSYAELSARVGTSEAQEFPGSGGGIYQLEFTVVWDDRPGGCVRVLGSVDDGGLRSFVPITDDFIMAADGSFVGE